MSKNCIKCHTPLSEDTSVCPNCGTKQSEEQTIVQNEASSAAPINEQNLQRKSSEIDLPSLIGMIAGGICSICGLVVLLMSGTYKLTPVTFGADFYTYIYEGVEILVDAANNVQTILAQGFGFLLIFLGIFMICFFWRTLFRKHLS